MDTQLPYEIKVTKERAEELIKNRFTLSYDLNLRYTEFEHVYPSTSGPLGGVGGSAMTAFILQAWYQFDSHGMDNYAVVFYEDKVLAVVNDFSVWSSYERR